MRGRFTLLSFSGEGEGSISRWAYYKHARRAWMYRSNEVLRSALRDFVVRSGERPGGVYIYLIMHHVQESCIHSSIITTTTTLTSRKRKQVWLHRPKLLPSTCLGHMS